MEEAVLFRSMIESLSPKEFNTFSTNLFATFNQRELLTKSLFHLISYYSRNALNTKYNTNINNILVSIIHARKNKNTNEENDGNTIEENNHKTDNKISISNIAYPLIAKCASYLNTSEVITFQYCNRHIYISCKKNSLSMTQLNNYNWFTSYINNNFGSIQARIKRLSRFNSVQCLNLKVDDYKKITNDGKNAENFAFKNVKKLSLNSMNLKSVLNVVALTKKLNYLSLNIGRCNTSQLLSFFSNITGTQISFLNFAHPHLLTNLISIDNQEEEMLKTFEFGKIFNSLKGIKMYDNVDANNLLFFNEFLSKISTNLQSYHISILQQYTLNRDYQSIWNTFGTNYKLNNLKELCFSVYKGIHDDICMDFLTPLANAIKECDLERLNINLNALRTSFTNNECSKCVTFITNILQCKKNLKYVSISGDNGMILRYLCQYIESKLKNNNNYKIFKSIKLSFTSWRIQTGNNEVIEHTIFELIDIVSGIVSRDFLIKCSLPWRKKHLFDPDEFDETNYFECVKRFESLKDKYNVDKITYTNGIIYIVTNKGAGFYGYHEKWDMNCLKCRQIFQD